MTPNEKDKRHPKGSDTLHHIDDIEIVEVNTHSLALLTVHNRRQILTLGRGRRSDSTVHHRSSTHTGFLPPPGDQVLPGLHRHKLAGSLRADSLLVHWLIQFWLTN